MLLSTFMFCLLTVNISAAPPMMTVNADGVQVIASTPVTRITVYMAGRDDELSGIMTTEKNTTTWKPKFAWTPNTDYAIEASIGEVVLKQTYRLPPMKPAQVTRIDPTASAIPANILRLYLHFNVPMQRGEGLKHVTITDAQGKLVADPFLELDEELWSTDGLRLTVFFDPGRIKRGLKPREEVGAAFTEDNDYTLTVKSTWPDAQGKALQAEYMKKFRVVAADYEPIQPKLWQINAPEKRRGPISVEFDKTLDRALAERMLSVVDVSGKPVDVRITLNVTDGRRATIGDEKTTWKPGKYRLVIDPRLEDICGNRVGRAFDVDLTKPKPNTAIFQVWFTVP